MPVDFSVILLIYRQTDGIENTTWSAEAIMVHSHASWVVPFASWEVVLTYFGLLNHRNMLLPPSQNWMIKKVKLVFFSATETLGACLLWCLSTKHQSQRTVIYQHRIVFSFSSALGCWNWNELKLTAGMVGSEFEVVLFVSQFAWLILC